MIPKSGCRFPARAKPCQPLVPSIDASAGQARSEKIMLKEQVKAKCRFNQKSFRFSLRQDRDVDLAAHPALRAAAAHAHHAGHESPGVSANPQ
jgi:hypothetical protein